MEEFLASAHLAAANDLMAPAHHHAMHALELGLKAALLSVGASPVRDHNPAGQFGLRFRGRVHDDDLRALNRTLARYHAARYPGTDMPEEEAAKQDLAFVTRFVHDVIRPLIEKTLT